MIDAPPNTDADSLLVLLPGSTITAEGIRLLCGISNFDPFIIAGKLKIKLPWILCPVDSREIAGSTGDLLKRQDIRFLAVKKKFFDLPFHPFIVTSCGFGKKRARFYNFSRDWVDIDNQENMLLLAGCYRTTDETLSCIEDDRPDFDADAKKKVKAVRSRDLKAFRFMMMFQVMDMNPLIFIDRHVDYSCLGAEKKLTVEANFNCLLKQIDAAFDRKPDRSMLEYGYVLEDDRVFYEQKKKGFALKTGKEMIAAVISNEAAVNRMARLLFFRWCAVSGWVERVMPGV